MKGIRRIDERVDEDTHQIRQYESRMVRRVQYRLKPCNEDGLDVLKTCFPEFLSKKKLKKLVPSAVVQGDSIIYKCPNKPTIHYDLRKGTVEIPSQDFKKFPKATQQNQAHFVIRQVKDCAKHYKVDYFDIHYLKRHLRYKMRPDPTRGGWNLFELPEN
jgi:hypothetical protein